MMEETTKEIETNAIRTMDIPPMIWLIDDIISAT